MSTVAPFGDRTAAEIRQMHQERRDRNQARHDDTVDFMAELAKAERLVTAVRVGVAELAATLPQPPAKRMVAIGNGDGVTAYDGEAVR